MRNITIISDIKFLPIGLTCIRSLTKTTSIPLIIHYYCVDDDTFTRLSSLNITSENVQIIPYSKDVLLDNWDWAIPIKNLCKNDYRYFLWALASIFSKFIMDKYNESVTYIDSDIYFYKDILNIYNEIGERDCGIFKHRFLDDGRNDDGSGRYNVGIVYFNSSKKGIELLNWWSDAVLHKKYPEYATCGDQKYLEYFPTVCNRMELYIDEHIGHGAPWDWQVYDLSKLNQGIIIWNNEELPLIFSHFSKFDFDFYSDKFTSIPKDGFYASINDNNIAFKNLDLIDLHRKYFEELKVSNDLLFGAQELKINTSKKNIQSLKWGLSR